MKQLNSKNFGAGLLFDFSHLDQILTEKPSLDWFELFTEQWMNFCTKPDQCRLPKNLEKLIQNYPVSLHGVELSIGSVDPLDLAYLKKLKTLAQRIQPIWVSDHLCWTGARKIKVHELLPLPYTHETLDHVCARIHKVQEFLNQKMIFENPPNYITFSHSEMSETEFLSALVKKTGCGLLLDINNLFVNCKNNHLDSNKYLSQLPLKAIRQLHLAGYEMENNFYLDNHSTSVSQEVWTLYEQVINLCGSISTSLEWDLNMPSFEVLVHEVKKARDIQNKNNSNLKRIAI